MVEITNFGAPKKSFPELNIHSGKLIAERFSDGPMSFLPHIGSSITVWIVPQFTGIGAAT
ncbi:hypothetical protein NLM24_12850 [Nocardia zapadnayensis]|uniref:hypothetical protein n=1 Tax=Nocardia rhamnosiphila TaxID=426716 RepID=UPI002247627B|nr:hypothetical protein [Nocardia zapadnayensis]MCX0271579.1 hypothetical protein [Nocardia zapadnayensis]